MWNSSTTPEWTSEKTERFRTLVLRHVANGGSIMDACHQFEFETNGVHKARMNHVRWMLFIRPQCKDEYRRAMEVRRTGKGMPDETPAFSAAVSSASPKADNTPEANATVAPAAVATAATLDIGALMEEEPLPVTPKGPQFDDEISAKLFHVVTEVLEDRKHLKGSVQDYRSRLDLSERKIVDLEEDNKLAQIKLDKKDREIENQERMLLDSQFKYQQLTDDYQQLRTNQAKEYERLQQQFHEIQNKFEVLNSEYSRYRANTTREVERLELQLRESEVKNSQLMAQFDAVRTENANLTRRITDFARQISNMLGTEVTPGGPGANIAAVPIRPSLNTSGDSEDRATNA